MKRMLLIVLSFLIILPFMSSIEECKKDLNVYIELKAFDEENSEKISNYQSPDYREDDYLALWRIVVENEANCTSEEYVLDLHFNNSEGKIDHFFCSYGIEIPKLQPKEKYFLYRTSFIERIDLDGGFIEREIYQDSNWKNFTFCKISMPTIGIWEAKAFLDPIGDIGWAGMWSFSLRDEGGYAPLKFKIRSKQELLALEQQKKSFSVSLITIILIGLATVLSQILSVFWQINKKRKFEFEKQKGLLNSLSTQLELISEDVVGHKKELRGKKIPSYFIYKFKADFYLTKLWEVIHNKKTRVLKKEVIKLEQKIDNINRLIELLQNSNLNGNISVRNRILNEVKDKNFKYHRHTKEIIQKIKKEISDLNLLENGKK